MENEFDPEWPYGHMVGENPARIICCDAKGDYPIVALVTDGDGSEHPLAFTNTGRDYKHVQDSMTDLRNAPAPKKRIKGWLNIYKVSGIPGEISIGDLHPSKDQADRHSGFRRFACICIDVEEGDGL